MMISTRGRYALRVLLELARQGDDSFVPLKDITAKEQISQKYLEAIMSTLSKGGLVEGAHGKGGGYRLTRPPQDYRVGEVLRLTEGSLAPVECVDCLSEPCLRAEACPTRPLWTRLDGLISDYLDSVTLAALLREQENKQAEL